MDDKDPQDARAAFEQIEQHLEGLLGRFGARLVEIADRLGEAGETVRERSFETPHGPVRTEVGVRFRMGGLDTTARTGRGSVRREGTGPGESPGARAPAGRAPAGGEAHDASGPAPQAHPASAAAPRSAAPARAAGVEPAAETAAGTPSHRAAQAAPPRQAETAAYVADGVWSVTMELPGVTLDEVALAFEGPDLTLRTTGARAFVARHEVPAGADRSDMSTVMRNGILVVSMPLAAGTGPTAAADDKGTGP